MARNLLLFGVAMNVLVALVLFWTHSTDSHKLEMNSKPNLAISLSPEKTRLDAPIDAATPSKHATSEEIEENRHSDVSDEEKQAIHAPKKLDPDLIREETIPLVSRKQVLEYPMDLKKSCTPQAPRDFTQRPILVREGRAPLTPKRVDHCDVPCFHTGDASLDPLVDVFLDAQFNGIHFPGLQCPDQRKALLSQESPRYYSYYDIPHSDPEVLMMTVALKSNVTVGYYSWIDWGIMTKNSKVPDANAHAAAFISNCNSIGYDRMGLIQELTKHGVKVDSYGRCMHNKDEIDQSGKVVSFYALFLH